MYCGRGKQRFPEYQILHHWSVEARKYYKIIKFFSEVSLNSGKRKCRRSWKYPRRFVKIARAGRFVSMVSEQLGNLPPLCKNIAGGWTQNAISIIFAKYRLVSEVLGIWFLRRAISNFVHNFLLISVKDWYSCQLLIFWSDDIVCWSKFPNFDMWVGCQKLSAILNLRLIEY